VKSMKKYIFVAKVSMQEALAYSMNFLGRGVFYIIIISIMVFLWKAIYAQGVDTGDYDVNRMIWYLIIGELIALSGARFYEEVSNDVKTGNIAYLMNKPYHYVNYQFAHYIGKTVIQLLVNCIIAIPLGLIYVTGPFSFLGGRERTFQVDLSKAGIYFRWHADSTRIIPRKVISDQSVFTICICYLCTGQTDNGF
jgi:ABC-type uncharacterized transport system permease subunit